VLDPITLDQLRTLVTVAEEGNFSAAARRLGRVQSAVSTTMANLEHQLGVPIWDRSTKVAKLTFEGQAVLAAARRVLTEVDALRRLTADMVVGVEASVSLCVDALFPLSALVDLCVEFAREFPTVDLRIDTQAMSAVAARVLDGTATIGVVSPLGVVPGLERQVLASIRMIAVVGPDHELAAHEGPVPTSRLADYVQIVLSERLDVGVPDQAVLSPRTWRVGDLHTKHAMLRANLGWGNLPEHLVREDVKAGKLVRIQPAAWGEDEHQLYLSAIYRRDTAFGPARRWVLLHLESLCLRDAGDAPEERRAGRRERPR
jgi:DNA-binding transcriptional LysR family regulator